MLRLSHAIERVSRRRWLGLLVVVCLALMLALLVLHTLEHGSHEPTALACAVVVIAAAVAALAFRTPRKDGRQRGSLRRGPPRLVPVYGPVRVGYPPGSIPLRL